MVRYEVILEVEPTLADAVDIHMRRDHIPAIFATGCFHRVHFDQASSVRFRTTYEAESELDLDRYLRDHAPTFRTEFQTRFPEGVTATREVWREREMWGKSS